jgi:hypothetical protein
VISDGIKIVMGRRLGFGLLAAAVAAAIGLTIHYSRWAEGTERNTFDWRAKRYAPDTSTQADPNVIIVEVDDRSLGLIQQRFGTDYSWPIPREFYPFMLYYMKQGGADEDHRFAGGEDGIDLVGQGLVPHLLMLRHEADMRGGEHVAGLPGVGGVAIMTSLPRGMFNASRARPGPSPMNWNWMSVCAASIWAARTMVVKGCERPMLPAYCTTKRPCVSRMQRLKPRREASKPSWMVMTGVSRRVRVSMMRLLIDSAMVTTAAAFRMVRMSP